MGTPLLGQFLTAINGFVQVKNESALADYLVLEPPFGGHYVKMIEELKATYLRGKEDGLEELCTRFLKAAKAGEEGSPWTAFIKFMAQYLTYLRDVSGEATRYLETYNQLSELQARANSALAHGTLGYLVLPTVVGVAKLVCRLAIGLDKQPSLIAHLTPQDGGEDGGARETLPERAANILRQAFVTCLNDRTPVPPGQKPSGRKRGIYLIANLCLKILFQCRKTRNATQIVENIYNLSPPLSAYPRRDRVTYLYYLGRFYFQNNHFYRAHLALEAAYTASPVREDCVRQRRQVLIYLIATNLLLGRFPSPTLLARPEARGLGEKFLPLCTAIRKGDLASFHTHLHHTADWLLHFRLLLPLRNRAEVLVWRSLVRKTWLLAGTRPTAGTKVAPTIDFAHLAAAFSALSPRETYTDPDFFPEENPPAAFGTREVESILSSLVDQGLLNGFFSHKMRKFAITGVGRKGGDVLAAGFPSPWGVLTAGAEGEVPGWKREGAVVGMGGMGAGVGPGMVVNLSGVRAVGAAG